MPWPFTTSPDDDPSAEAEAPNVPPADRPPLTVRREAARELRALTRNGPREPHLLSTGTPQERINRISRSRTPSPNPPPTTSSTQFEFTAASSATKMDDEQIERMISSAVKRALAEDRADRDRQSALHTEAAVTAALNNQSNQIRSLRKPELPPLDKKNIEQWISRIEYAYTRAEVKKAKDKLAFLESKFVGCDDAQLNELLKGTTDNDWTKFIDYLRDIYGRTKEDKINSLLSGFPRESRRPQQLASHIRERIGDINLDDILREVLLREIPAEVRQHAATAIKTLDFQATADHLEVYFDKQGRVLNTSKSSTGINSVQPQQHRSRPLQSSMKQEPPSRTTSTPSTQPSESSTSYTSVFSDEEEASDVNAVRFRRDGQKQTFDVSNRSQSRGRSQRNDSSRSNNNSNSQSRPVNRYSSNGGRFNSSNSNNNNSRFNGSSNGNNNSGSQSKVCSFHSQYGDKARSCKEGCMLWAQHQSKGQASN